MPYRKGVHLLLGFVFLLGITVAATQDSACLMFSCLDMAPQCLKHRGNIL
jgi:hypothetical protein